VTLTCTISLFYNTVKNVKNISYVIGAAMNSIPMTMSVPVYGTVPDYCLLTPVELSITNESKKETPEFVLLDKVSNTVSIKSDDPSLVGSYTLRFIAKETRQGFVDSTVSFQINITCEINNFMPVYSTSTVQNMVYALRTVPVQITMPNYTWQPT
jgi:hypothetical protein